MVRVVSSRLGNNEILGVRPEKSGVSGGEELLRGITQ